MPLPAIDFSPYRLAEFRPEHTAQVVRIIEDCYAEYAEAIELDTLDRDLLEIENVYAGPRAMFRVLLDPGPAGGRPVGTVAFKMTGPCEGELKRVFLERACRGRGLGGKLVLSALDWARERGCRTAHIWSDVLYATAHRLYRRLGAEDTGTIRLLGGRNQVYERYLRLALPAGPAERRSTGTT